MAELTAVGKYIQFWYPEIPTWASAAAFFVIINAINLTNVKVFGEMEFWFAIIKVIAVIAMILFGAWLLFSDTAGAGNRAQPVGTGRLSAAWLTWAGDDDGHYYVFVWRTGAGRDHRR